VNIRKSNNMAVDVNAQTQNGRFSRQITMADFRAKTK